MLSAFNLPSCRVTFPLQQNSIHAYILSQVWYLRMVLILCICCRCLYLRNIFRTEYFPKIYSYALDGFVPDRLIVSYGERGCSNLPIILKMLSITILLKYFADVAFVKLYFATIVTKTKQFILLMWLLLSIFYHSLTILEQLLSILKLDILSIIYCN